MKQRTELMKSGHNNGISVNCAEKMVKDDDSAIRRVFEITIGEEIKRLRNKNGLSSRELARRSKISQPYLSQLETGKNNNPTTQILRKIAKGLGVSYIQLLEKAGYLEQDN